MDFRHPSDRSYRPALPREAALRELRAAAGTQFDPAVVVACLEELEGAGSEPEVELGVVGEISAHVRDLLAHPAA